MILQGLRASYVQTRLGIVHAVETGAGFPILLLHQTPRSWDEYRAVLPLLGHDFRAIAMDTPGFGASPTQADDKSSIELWARTALALLDALSIETAAIVGHHTGAAIALEIAASVPSRVAALVLSACPFVDAERRARHSERPAIDEVEPRADGAHLTELWERRRPYYPKADIALLTRFMADALRCGKMAAEGHRVVNRYRMEDRIGRVTCPTLVLAPTDDPHAFQAAPRVAAAIRGAILRDATGAMVPFPDQSPDLFARLVRDFVSTRIDRSAS
jgi:pimeloyl-ACP methyl ester carboxylesterase